jgi:hypothetical protein
MAEELPTAEEPRSLVDARSVDRLCDRFEAAWRDGSRPALEAFLAEAPATCRPEALRQLLLLDIEYRRRAGEVPAPEDYLPLGGDDEVIVAEVLGRRPPAILARPTPGCLTSSGSPPATLVQVSGGDRPVPTIPGYEILGEVGRGGMGVVYEARQVSLGRRVALKVLPFAATTDPQQLQRFRNEATTAAMLDHPNIVPVYEVGQWQPGGSNTPVPYFSMKLVKGRNLAQKQGGVPWFPWEAARFVEVISRAVAHAHRHGVVHRDLKPANVLVADDGTPQVADFGLAKRLELVGPTLTSQVLLGTPTYMAPEQAAGQLKLVGPHTDVHALGAILYELLTGRPPFKGATPLDTLEQVRLLEPVPPTRLQPKVPRDLEAVCLKCLQKEPARRYADGQALADDLERFLAGRPTEARPAGVVSRAALWCRRPERVRDAGAFMVFLGLVFTAWCVSSLILRALGVLTVHEAVSTNTVSVYWLRILLALGVLDADKPWAFVRWLLICIGVVYLPMAWLGWKIIQRRLAALWAGLFVTTASLAALVMLQITGTTPADDVSQRYEASRLAGESLLVILAGIQAFACATALVAYYSNRRAIRWSVADAKGEPGPQGATDVGP